MEEEENIIESSPFEIHGKVICIDDIGHNIVKKYPYEIMAMGSIILSKDIYVWNCNLYSTEVPVYGYELIRKYSTNGYDWSWGMSNESVILPIDLVIKHFISLEDIGGADNFDTENTRINRNRDINKLLS